MEIFISALRHSRARALPDAGSNSNRKRGTERYEPRLPDALRSGSLLTAEPHVNGAIMNMTGFGRARLSLLRHDHAIITRTWRNFYGLPEAVSLLSSYGVVFRRHWIYTRGLESWGRRNETSPDSIQAQGIVFFCSTNRYSKYDVMATVKPFKGCRRPCCSRVSRGFTIFSLARRSNVVLLPRCLSQLAPNFFSYCSPVHKLSRSPR